MGGLRIALLLLVTVLACRSGKTLPEEGAVLLHVKQTAGTPMPEELLAWVYDDTGRLWDGVRIPAEGPLLAAGGEDLGTILIQPGAIQGGLRIHLRALAAGARLTDGTLKIDSPAAGDRIFDLRLEAALPLDEDGDDVPDAIDDCLKTPNPAQGGCPAPEADAGPDAGPETTPDLGADVEPAADALLDESAPWEDAEPDVLIEPDVLAQADERTEENDGAPADTRDAVPRADREALPCDGDNCAKPQGAPCAAGGECSSGWCADGVCCTNACVGPCRSCNQPSASGICQGYPAGSDPDLECPSSSCNGVGACGPATSNLANGSLCNSASQCTSGFCVDGVCCDSACAAPCQACGTGVCLAVKKADDIPECTGTTTCNPRGVCTSR